MENAARFREIWGNIQMPVLVFAAAKGQSTLIFQNKRAEALCPGHDSVLDEMPEQESRELLLRMLEPDAGREPLFCHVGGQVYSAVLFGWAGYSVCMLHDVSGYYRSMETRMDEAVMANRAKTNFLSEMSHDIRTPMNAIIGMTDIALTQKDMPVRIREYLNKIKTASGHMMSIINEVLDMSRIESGRITLLPEEVEIGDLLHEILVVARPQSDAKNQKFELQIGQIDHERIIADALRFKQVCLNLLSNAVKFTPEGGSVTMFLEMKREKGGNRVMTSLYVRDTGIGMSREFLTRVFTPFEREQSLTISKIQGTGLGMAIAKNLVELMGGRITVESELGVGSCFYVDVPFPAADMHLEAYEKALSGRRILLLDDQESRASSLTEMAARVGVTVDWAKGPEQAVYFINDAVFSDYEYFAFLTVENIEGMEMMSFLPEIRRRMGSDFPILLLAAGDWQQIEYMFTRAGVDAFIPLPLFGSRLYAGLYAFTGQGREVQEMENGRKQCRYESKTILLVEDNELNREIALEILQMTGVSVETAENGRQALEKFLERPPFYYDLILMDIQMPVMNGLDAARTLRGLERPDAREVPIVAMTANAFVEDVNNSLEAGMDAHVTKPLDMEVLFDCLERFLGRRGK